MDLVKRINSFISKMEKRHWLEYDYDDPNKRQGTKHGAGWEDAENRSSAKGQHRLKTILRDRVYPKNYRITDVEKR